MSRLVVGIACALLIGSTPGNVIAGNSHGGASDDADAGGGNAQISTWVVGAVNGGVSKPAGSSTCTAWELYNGSNMGGLSDPRIIDPVTGDIFLVYFRICDRIYQFVYIGPTDPIDIAEAAYQQVSALVRRPEVAFSPPIDKMIVNFETWLGVTPQQPVSATAAIPGLAATVTAVPTSIEWSTGSKVAGDTTKIHCEPWGSTESAQSGCTWTPAYPSVGKVTGTTDLRYHGSVTIVWKVAWQATNGVSGTLDDLRTTTPVQMTVQEIQTIGG